MMSIVFTRLVLGYLLTLPFVVPWLAGSISGEQAHTLVLRMSANVNGQLQVFYDIGTGFSEQNSTATNLVVSDKAFEYRFPLPLATYHGLRIDPGVASGTYRIERVAIAGADGSTTVAIPLTELQAVQQLNVLERTPDRLVVSAPQDSNDPMLVWAAQSPFTLAFEPGKTRRTLRYATLLWLGGTLAVWGAARMMRSVWPGRASTLASISSLCASRPLTAIVSSALVATILATYPVLFAGRSLAAPGNGGTQMLYSHPPFVPGSEDFYVEDVRGSDTGAMMWQSVPHSVAERNALAAGEIPLWNRYTALGRPLWGQGLSYVLDPLQWITFVGVDPALGWDFKFVAHRLLFAIGIGLASLAATGAWLPSALAAAAAPFVGGFTYRLNHPAVFALTYAPWTLLAWFLIAKATTVAALARATLLLAVTSSLLLVAPTPKEGALTLLGVSATGAIAVLLSVGSRRLRLIRLAAAILAGLAVVLITAPHWLVFLDTLHTSAHLYERPYVIVGGFAQAIGFWISPILHGPLQPGFHCVGLVLVTAAVTAPRRLWEDRSTAACAIGAVLLIGVAFGVVPTEKLIAIPLVSQVGHLYDALVMAALTPLLIVGATGARILLSTGSKHTLVVTMVTAAASLWIVAMTGKASTFDRFEPWAIAVMLPLVVAWPTCMLEARRRADALLAAGATMLVLLLPAGLHVESGVPAIDRLLLQPRPRPRLEQSSPAIDAIRKASTEPTRAAGVSYTFFAGTHMMYGLEDLRGADPLEVPAYRELIDASGMRRQWYWFTWFEAEDVPRLNPVLDMFNVGFLLGRADAVPPGSTVLPTNGPDLIRAIQRPTAWPRAYFVEGAVTYTTPADLVLQLAERRTPFAAVLAGDVRAAAAMDGLSATTGSATPADSYALTANTTSFRVRSNREGLAVLGETFLPDDFAATLNGKPVPYFRVNHVFKAVRIPGRGDWHVRFEYRPRRWGVALAAAGLGLLFVITFAVVALTARTALSNFESDDSRRRGALWGKVGVSVSGALMRTLFRLVSALVWLVSALFRLVSAFVGEFWIPVALTLFIGLRWLLGERHSIYGDEFFHLSNLFNGVSSVHLPLPQALINLYLFNFAYPPIFYLLSAPFIFPATDPVLAGRIYALVLTLFVCVVLYSIVRSHAGKLAGAVSVATLLGTPSFVDVSRHYLLEPLIMLEALLVLLLIGRYYETGRRVVLFWIATVLSVGLLTKFNFVIYALPLFVVPSVIEITRVLRGRQSVAHTAISLAIIVGIPLVVAGPWYLARATGATGMLATLYQAGTLNPGFTLGVFIELVLVPLSDNYSVLLQILGVLGFLAYAVHVFKGRHSGVVLLATRPSWEVVVASAFVGALSVPIALALVGLSATSRWHIEACFFFVAMLSVLGRLRWRGPRMALLSAAFAAGLLQLVAISVVPLPLPAPVRVPQPDMTPRPSGVNIGSEQLASDIASHERLVGGTKPGEFISFLYHEHRGPHFGSVEWYLRFEGAPLASRIAAFYDRAIDVENIVDAKYLVEAVDGEALRPQDPETLRYRALAARLPTEFRNILVQVSDVQGRFGRFKVWYVPRQRVTRQMVLDIIETGRMLETVQPFLVLWDAQRIVWRAQFEQISGNASLAKEVDALMAAFPASEPQLSTINRERLQVYLARIAQIRQGLQKAA